MQHIAAVETLGDALVLTMMRFAQELTDIDAFQLPSTTDVRGKELEMATALIDNLSVEWNPAKYTDEYRENLMRVIQAKMKGRKPRLREEARPQDADVIDLMERLQRSLAAGKTGARRSRASRPRTRTRRRTRAA